MCPQMEQNRQRKKNHQLDTSLPQVSDKCVCFGVHMGVSHHLTHLLELAQYLGLSAHGYVRIGSPWASVTPRPHVPKGKGANRKSIGNALQ